jgi:hypothetical protein
MNTTWNWRAHSTNLLSREFEEIVKQHLVPGGLFYFNTTFSIDACKTALSEFAHTERVLNFVAGSDAPLSIDLAVWRRVLEDYRIDGRPVVDPTHPGEIDALVAFLKAGDKDAHVEEDASLRRSCAAGEVITDDNMLTEWRQLMHWERP